MKIIRLQVAYEKLFPHRYLNLTIYKKVIQSGLLEKLTQDAYEDEAKLKEHLLKFFLIEKLMEKK